MVALALILVIGAVVLSIIATHFEPLVREHIVKILSQRYNADVQLGALHVTMFPSVAVTGENLALRRKATDDPGPVIAVRRFSVQTGIRAVLATPIHISFVRLEGLHITVPRGRRDAAPKQPNEKTAQPGSRTLVIDNIDADGAFVEVLPRDPQKQPLQFQIKRLVLKAVGVDRPMEFRAELTNPKPPGLIESTGHFGPFQGDEPGDTPLDGHYEFDHADLSVFRGIAGMLSSTGEYNGKLHSIEVRGQTDTPDFSVSTSGQPVDLKTTFSATVDGTDGDTYLHPVDATFGSTDLICNGTVEHFEGQPGKTKAFDVVSKRGRIEDLLRLAVKGKPVMIGDVSLQTKLLLPQGSGDVIQKLQLDGTFKISKARFTGSAIQEKITDLSLRAQGRAKEAQETNVGPGATDPVTVASDFNGTFGLKNETVIMSHVAFSVPGAMISLSGRYGLRTEKLDFAGIFHMDTTVSKAFTGWKSLLLKAADPFFSKHGQTDIPIHIEGTRQHPEIGLDLFHKQKQGR